jgi:putative ABC transport system permease protein
MLKNILITSLRNFFRNKIFSLINLIGLSVSMSLGMLIILIIKDQLAFDNFHKDTDRIFRVNTHVVHPEWGKMDFASTPLPLAEVLKDEYSLTDNIVRVSRQLHGDATYGTIKVPVSGLFADQAFLDMFNFPLAEGDPATALTKPNSLVLTKQAAEKIFGTINPLGQSISYAGYGDFTITGVLGEFPGKTHLEFQMLCSMSTLPVLEKTQRLSASIDTWSAFYNNYVYIKLKEGRNPAEAEQALAQINKKYCAGLKLEGHDLKYDGFYLHPLSGITPGPELADHMGRGMPSPFLIFLGVLAAVVLLMSLFNFTNLTIARSLTRAREIGVRKVVGANRQQVFFQFIGEAVVFALIALSFSYILMQFLKVGFQQLSLSKDFSMEMNEDVTLYAIFIVFAIIVGMLAGALPAGYLSAFKPARVLKDVQNLKIYARLTFRKVLMVAQFTLSVIFVIVVLIVYRQVDFMLNADYGIRQKNNLTLDLKGAPFEKLANEIRNVPGVIRVGGVSHRLGTFDDNTSEYKKNRDEKSFAMRDFMVDDNYIENVSLDFVAGRNFDASAQTGVEKHVILNEAALEGFGFQHPAEAIGQAIYVADTLALEVIGVVKDFHFRPLNNRIGPLALRYNISRLSYLNANIHPSKVESATASIKAIWKAHDPNHPVDLTMMEQEIDDAYRQTGLSDMPVIVGYIAFLVVSLACLGMIGMAMYASQIRAKEVGIRKVMGASVTNMIILLSKSYLALIAVALIIGIPVSLLLGRLFLQEYPYRVEMTPALFVSGIAIVAGLGLLTVWSQTIKVAASNPVKWLRNE